MPRYAHRSGGSGEITYTTSPLYNWGQHTGEGAEKPPLHKGEYPSDVVTHKHPAPVGERDRYDDRLAPRYSESGSNYAGFAPGKSDSGATAPSGKYSGLKQGLYHKYQDRFNQGFGQIGSGEVGAKGSGGPAQSDRGVAYKDGEGRTKYRGRSG